MRGEGVTSQVAVLNVEKSNFLNFFFPRLYPIYSGGAHYSEAKKGKKLNFLEGE